MTRLLGTTFIPNGACRLHLLWPLYFLYCFSVDFSSSCFYLYFFGTFILLLKFPSLVILDGSLSCLSRGLRKTDLFVLFVPSWWKGKASFFTRHFNCLVMKVTAGSSYLSSFGGIKFCNLVVPVKGLMVALLYPMHKVNLLKLRNQVLNFRSLRYQFLVEQLKATELSLSFGWFSSFLIFNWAFSLYLLIQLIVDSCLFLGRLCAYVYVK